MNMNAYILLKYSKYIYSTYAWIFFVGSLHYGNSSPSLQNEIQIMPSPPLNRNAII